MRCFQVLTLNDIGALWSKSGASSQPQSKTFFKVFKPSLLDHDTTAELLLLTGTDQLLDIRLDAGAQGPTALLGQEGERPLGWDGVLELQVLWGHRVEMWPLADVQTSL